MMQKQRSASTFLKYMYRYLLALTKMGKKEAPPCVFMKAKSDAIFFGGQDGRERWEKGNGISLVYTFFFGF